MIIRLNSIINYPHYTFDNLLVSAFAKLDHFCKGDFLFLSNKDGQFTGNCQIQIQQMPNDILHLTEAVKYKGSK